MHRRVIGGALLSVFLLGASVCRAGSISGRVVDADANPIAEVQVKLEWTPFGDLEGQTTTDASGHYQFDDIDSGILYLYARLDDLHTVGLPGDVPCIAPDGCLDQPEDTIILDDGQSLILSDIVLRPAAVLEVNVLDHGVPSTEQMILKLSSEQYGSARIRQSPPLRLPSLPPGAYTARLLPQDENSLDLCGDDTTFDEFSRVPCHGDHEIVLQADAVRELQLHLQPGAIISGHVVDAVFGIPANNLDVLLYNASDPEHSPMWAYGNGQYRFTRLLGRSYRVRFGESDSARYVSEYFDDVTCPGDDCDPQQATLVTPSTGQQIGNIDAALQPRQWITGQVIDALSQTPLADVQVQKLQGNAVFWFFSQSTVTNAQGMFVLSGVEWGGFTLRAIDLRGGHIGMQIPDFTCDFANALCDDVIPASDDQGHWLPPFQLEPDQSVTGLTLALDSGATVQGHVRNAVTGAPVSHAEVDLGTDGDTGYMLILHTDAAGRYITPGTRPVTLTGRALNLEHAQLYSDIDCIEPDACDYDSATPIVVDEDQQVTGIDFQLAPDTDTLFSSGFESQ